MGGERKPTAEQEKMLATLRATVDANPADAAAKFNLANLLYDLDRHAEAVPLYRAYVKSNPENLDARTDMAYSIYRSGDVEGAINELKDVIAGNPRHQTAALNLSMMYIEKGDRDSMMVWMDRVVEIDSTSTQGKRALDILKALKEAHATDTTASASAERSPGGKN